MASHETAELDFSDEDHENEEMNQFSINIGAMPFQYEPVAGPATAAEEVPPRPNTMEDHSPRVGNTDWCTCKNCIVMETAVEAVCCREQHKVVQKLQTTHPDGSSGTPPQCITSHPGFQTVCLNQWVLETAYYAYRQTYGAHPGNTSERYRFTAYRQFVRFVYSYLGPKIRVPLPSCAVNKIRTQYPSEERYTGYIPSLDNDE